MFDTFYQRMHIDLFTDNVQAYNYPEDFINYVVRHSANLTFNLVASLSRDNGCLAEEREEAEWRAVQIEMDNITRRNEEQRHWNYENVGRIEASE